jgi:hypothetical protein
MQCIQYDFFKSKEECEIEGLLKKMDELEISMGKVRRGLFAKHSELFKKMDELSERLAVIERNICRKED